MSKEYLALLAAMALTSLAFADIEFADVDADKDGFVSVEESAAIPGLKEAWTDFDEDADGQLNEEEFTNYIDVAEPADRGG